MKLIIGLGNPDKQYDGTRHNIGFRVLDDFAAKHELSWKLNRKLRAETTEYVFDDTKVLLAKPTTYYNLAGESARAIADFYKINLSEILVVHDDLDIPFGKTRTRNSGSDAGNNGVKSISQHIGPNFHRVRVGIKNELSQTIDAADFVLSKFNSKESPELSQIIEKAHQCIDEFIAGSFEHKTI